MTLAAAAAANSDLVTVLLAFLGVIQTVALAVIADRSRRVRRDDATTGRAVRRPPAQRGPAEG